MYTVSFTVTSKALCRAKSYLGVVKPSGHIAWAKRAKCKDGVYAFKAVVDEGAVMTASYSGWDAAVNRFKGQKIWFQINNGEAVILAGGHEAHRLASTQALPGNRDKPTTLPIIKTARRMVPEWLRIYLKLQEKKYVSLPNILGKKSVWAL